MKNLTTEDLEKLDKETRFIRCYGSFDKYMALRFNINRELKLRKDLAQIGKVSPHILNN